MEFANWVNDVVCSIAHSICKLLMRLVEVNIGVRADGSCNTHALVNDAEFGLYQRFVAYFILKYLNAVIARKQQPRVFVGQGQAVMRVELGGIERVFVVFDRAVIETSKVVAFEKPLRCCPVGITVFDVIDEAMIIVTQFVELYR